MGGLITCGEFGRFMRLGLPHDSGSKRLDSLQHAKQQHVVRLKQQAASLSATRADELRSLVEAKHTRAIEQREGRKQATGSAAESVKKNKLALAAIVRKDKVKNLTVAAAGDRVAKLPEVEQVASMLNQRMDMVILDKAARSWFKLFNHMDDDGSGNVMFHELEDMIRNELAVPEASLSREQLQAIWRTLDTDNSGFITCGEFGRFMRKGSLPEDKQRTPRKLLALEQQRECVAARQQRQKLLAERHATEGAALSARQGRAATSHSESWGGATLPTKPAPWRSARAREVF